MRRLLPSLPPVAVAFAAVVLAMLPAVLDQTMLSTGLPVIATKLGRVSDVSWIVTAYVVAAAAATPLWGKLGDRLGRKRMLELSLGWFVIASAPRRTSPSSSRCAACRASPPAV